MVKLHRIGALVVALLAAVPPSVAFAAPKAVDQAAVAHKSAPAAARAKSSKASARVTEAKSRPAKGATSKASKGQQSIGAPNGGRLVGGVRLKGTRHLRQREGARSWGITALTRLLHHSADAVAKKHPSSMMVVGDLSAREGGSLDGHRSHQSGRDADIGFYATNSRGKPVNVKRFVAFDSAGKGRELTWASFDDARNWAMVEAMVKDEKARVRYVFVSPALRARLLAYAAKKKVSKEVQARAAVVMASPRDAELHDDHFHVRIACPETMRGTCTEESSVRGENPEHVASAGTPRGPDAVEATDAPRDAAPQAPAGATEAPR